MIAFIGICAYSYQEFKLKEEKKVIPTKTIDNESSYELSKGQDDTEKAKEEARDERGETVIEMFDEFANGKDSLQDRKATPKVPNDDMPNM